jgi:hypothetical protein
MSDTSTTLNVGTGGDAYDAELIGSIKRTRAQIGGAALAEIARVKNALPLATDYGLVMRAAPSVNIAGLYRFVSASRTVPATADNGTSTGGLWIQNPVGNSKNARILRMDIHESTDSQLATADITGVPQITYARFTFTGTASGGSLSVMKRTTTDATNSVIVRTAVTGMTVTLGVSGWCLTSPGVSFMTAAGVNRYQYTHSFPPESNDEFFADVAPGEGIVILSLGAGLGTSRVYTTQASYLEYTP